MGFPCGGWCPQGRKAEDGAIPDRYPLQELPGAGYLQRTRKNIEDSDGTLVIAFGAASGGTLRTIEFCRQLNRPHLIIDAAATSIEDAVRSVLEFVQGRRVGRLNVACPRASGGAAGLCLCLQRGGESVGSANAVFCVNLADRVRERYSSVVANGASSRARICRHQAAHQAFDRMPLCCRNRLWPRRLKSLTLWAGN